MSRLGGLECSDGLRRSRFSRDSWVEEAAPVGPAHHASQAIVKSRVPYWWRTRTCLHMPVREMTVRCLEGRVGLTAAGAA